MKLRSGGTTGAAHNMALLMNREGVVWLQGEFGFNVAKVKGWLPPQRSRGAAGQRLPQARLRGMPHVGGCRLGAAPAAAAYAAASSCTLSCCR